MESDTGAHATHGELRSAFGSLHVCSQALKSKHEGQRREEKTQPTSQTKPEFYV